jgi:hypothetical protein
VKNDVILILPLPFSLKQVKSGSQASLKLSPEMRNTDFEQGLGLCLTQVRRKQLATSFNLAPSL